MYRIARTEAEIDEQLNRAAEAVDDGTRFPGASYEEGVMDAMSWILGQDDTAPLPNDDDGEADAD